MKRIPLVLAAAALLLLASCAADSFESDVRKIADYRCRLEKLISAENPDQKKIQEVQKEMEDFGSELADKYKDKRNDPVLEEKAEKIMKEEMAKCKS